MPRVHPGRWHAVHFPLLVRAMAQPLRLRPSRIRLERISTLLVPSLLALVGDGRTFSEHNDFHRCPATGLVEFSATGTLAMGVRPRPCLKVVIPDPAVAIRQLPSIEVVMVESTTDRQITEPFHCGPLRSNAVIRERPRQPINVPRIEPLQARVRFYRLRYVAGSPGAESAQS